MEFPSVDSLLELNLLLIALINRVSIQRVEIHKCHAIKASVETSNLLLTHDIAPHAIRTY